MKYRKLNKLIEQARTVRGTKVKVIYDNGREALINLLDCFIEPENIREVIPIEEMSEGYKKALEVIKGLVDALHE